MMHCYSSDSQEKMVRRGNFWNSRRGIKEHWPILIDNFIPNFYEKVSLITITNMGYLPITMNCVKSIDRLKLKCPLKIYSIDKECFEELEKKEYTNRHFLGDIHSKSVKYQDENWSIVTMQKIVSIKTELEKSEIVVYIDGDITVEDSRFITYCYERLEKNKDLDMLAQREWRGKKDREEICSGFLAIRSSEKTKEFFTPDPNKKYRNDQQYVNSKKKSLNIELLPETLFPNGKYYYHNKSNIDPYLIHFNFVMSHDKIPKIKANKKWY